MNTNASSSTTNQWLTKAESALKASGSPTPRLDCLVLIEDVTKKDRSWLLAHPDFELSKSQVKELDKCVGRRVLHEPLAYIRGKTEFYGREFLVNSHTLEPRPETETMIELLKQLLEGGRWKVEDSVVDVGTGSGCIAITAKLEKLGLEVIGVDIDAKCIETAERNAKKLGANVRFYKGSLLEPIPSSIFHLPSSKFAVLANLPYVPDKYELNAAAQFEPKHAIFGGEDGLDLYRGLFAQLKVQGPKSKIQHVLTESLPFQHRALVKIAKEAGYSLEKTDDFIQVFSL